MPSVHHETALARLRRLLPRKMRAADREAMRFQAVRPKSLALKSSEIWPNDDERTLAIVVDVDADPVVVIDPIVQQNVRVLVATETWLDAGVQRPNLVIENPRSGHAHLVYLLADPIWCNQRQAPRYARAIQRALTRTIPGGDRKYTWPYASMHNPWSERYRVTEVQAEPYRLGKLAQGLDLDAVPRRYGAALLDDAALGLARGGRNDGLFRWLLTVAACFMRAARNEDEYEQAMEAEAYRLNATFLPPMDPKEVGGTLRSVLRYRRYRRRDRAAELKAKRHAEGRSLEARLAATRKNELEARRLRGLGMTLRAIAERLGVTSRTVARYLSLKAAKR